MAHPKHMEKPGINLPHHHHSVLIGKTTRQESFSYFRKVFLDIRKIMW